MTLQTNRTDRAATGQPVGMSQAFAIDAAKRLVRRADVDCLPVNQVQLKLARAIVRAAADLPPGHRRAR